MITNITSAEKAAILAPYAEMGIRTYEDIAELNATEGWGCKCCGKLHAAAWLTCKSGDIYCPRCAAGMRRELRIDFVAFPTREESGLKRTVERVYNPDSQGWEVAAFQRREHERIYG